MPGEAAFDGIKTLAGLLFFVYLSLQTRICSEHWKGMTTMNNLEYGSNGRILFFLALLLHSALGLAGEPASSVDGYVRGSVKNSPFLNAVIICFGILAVVGIAIVLYRKWQKKKREEQHARLLRLFEEDDDLEAELGLRD